MKNFDELYDLAEGNFGLITYAQARELGVSIRELDRWMRIGRLERPARGVYRVSRFPPSDADPYALATEKVGADAFLYGESVLAFLKLAPTNPTWIYVSTAKRVRKALGSGLKIVRCAADYACTNYDGVRSQFLVDAIRSCRDTVRPDRRIQAAEEGRRQGYLSKDESRGLIWEIGNETAK
ncbi:MAG: type IV toxin-antitoxin system AbiEi family antitoxin domain-containing protein [bacterium]|nr:type IV toxin-antitoxin system AbiEi family antitoxin domain-containing protein [bacterium]